MFRQDGLSRETGEEIQWLVSFFLNGFYPGYRATRDTICVDLLVMIRFLSREVSGFLIAL
ncbi:MAG: hypothetical protein ACYTFW_04810 [Planctomycetota bacterium]